MKKIIEHLHAEWYKYLLEILVITIGILGAFTLNNWNENRKDRNNEVYLLNRLHKEVVSDSLTLARYIDLNKGHEGRGDYLLNNLDNPAANMDSIVSCVFFSGRFVWFQSSSPTYDEIVSSGRLGIIQNDSLKNLISSYYGRLESYVNFQFYESREIKAEYNRHKNRYFDLSMMTDYWKAKGAFIAVDSMSQYLLDWDGFRQDPETPIHLRNSRGVNRELSYQYATGHMNRLHNLLTAIRKEIKEVQ
ncbi:hypothetical protein SAMN05421640_0460 [Ekhidna lutea]|uniref:Uncharacterized protein n=1 Tax=Ekhidna lutea TaxID=447679 RepID=A0A239F3B6_EKHLU|nr:DUF6090 family protein [Ekhidna lutea]SNS51191.1 hypothetical protein SAMN05421640_0460 [Ekhidna lutea]